MKKIIRALLPVIVVTLAAGPALADKLIVFKNGKVLRAKEVTSEGKWTYADLGKGATVGVRTADILNVEDSAGTGKDEGYNRASTDNRGVSRDSGGRADRRRDRGRERSASVQERIEQRQRQLEEEREKQKDRNRGTNRNLRGGASGLRPLQPFNQRNIRNSTGLRRSRMAGGRAQRSATDQRLANTDVNSGDDDN